MTRSCPGRSRPPSRYCPTSRARWPAGTVAFSREGTSWFWEIVTEWDRPEDDGTFHTWLDATRDDIKPHLRGNCYVNLSTDQGPAWRRGIWGSPAKYRRLVATKTAWDPHNLLRYNKNIAPRLTR